MPIISVYECPCTQKIFKLDKKHKYLLHLKSLAKKKRAIAKKEQLRAEFVVTLSQYLSEVNSFAMLADFLNTNACTIARLYSRSLSDNPKGCTIEFIGIRYSSKITRYKSIAYNEYDVKIAANISGFYGKSADPLPEWYQDFLAVHCGIYCARWCGWLYSRKLQLDLSWYPQLKASVDRQRIDDIPDKLVRKLKGKSIAFKYKDAVSPIIDATEQDHEQT